MKLKKIKPGMVIHCKTEIEALYLLEHLSKLGFVWLSSRNLLDDTNYRTHGNETCYEFVRDSEKRITFGSYEFYEDNKRDIVEFSSLIIEEKTYEDGLNEAWAVAKKIALNTEDGGIPNKELREIFETKEGFTPTYWAFMNFTAEEAIDKLEAYEAEKQIKVGDVVMESSNRGVVTGIDGERFYITWCDGSSGRNSATGLKKTGKHIDISSILAEIGKE